MAEIFERASGKVRACGANRVCHPVAMIHPLHGFRRLRSGVLSFGFVAGLAVGLTVGAAAEKAEWKEVSKTGDLTLFEKEHPGSGLREFRGVSTFEAPPLVIKRVLDDVEAYPRFMPYVIEARNISSDAKSRVSYQRISPPVVGDRDYTVKVLFETRMQPGGVAYFNRWQAANDLGPAEKPGVTRVKVTEGSWLLEPAGGGKQTQATYTVFTDSGGSMPAFLLNTAGKTAVPKVFAAVRKQALLPKYQEAH